MADFWTIDRLHTMAILDFTGIIRCDDLSTWTKCADESRFAMRCKHCDEVTVLCAMHAQKLLAASAVHCRNCRHWSQTASSAFEVEALG